MVSKLVALLLASGTKLTVGGLGCPLWPHVRSRLGSFQLEGFGKRVSTLGEGHGRALGWEDRLREMHRRGLLISYLQRGSARSMVAGQVARMREIQISAVLRRWRILVRHHVGHQLKRLPGMVIVSVDVFRWVGSCVRRLVDSDGHERCVVAPRVQRASEEDILLWMNAEPKSGDFPGTKVDPPHR